MKQGAMEGANGLVALLLLMLSLTTTSWAQLLHDTATKPAAKIAVIGGGIGGTAAAYFLHDLFGDEVLIDVYEPDRVGGRLATLSVAGQEYETGGSVIHPANQYMKNFASQFGLSHTTTCSESVGLFNGEDYVFTSSNIGLVDFVKLFMRYGWDVYRLQKVPAAVIQDFVKIYKLQHEGQAFKDVASLLSAMSKEMLRMTQMSTFDWLTEQGFSPLTISELVMSALQCNYGQTPEMHAFVGLIALAGADSSLWSVEGGNKRVAEELLKHSRASLLQRRVTQVAPSTSSASKFVVWSHEPEEIASVAQKDAAQESKEIHREQEYDAVILATPLTQDNSKIQLVNFTQQFSFSGHYEPIETTIVRGVVRPESLMLNDDEMLDNILVINPRLMFNSFGRLQPVKGKKCDQETVGVWKIFSPHKIPDDQLDIFFQRREVTNAISWLAYPHYSTNQTLGDFELAPGLYHLNAIEWAGSAMEMSVIGAKNVALLAYKQWKNDPNAGKKPPVKEEL